MKNEYRKPYLKVEGFESKPCYFPYSYEHLTERAIFPTIAFDVGGYQFANDAFGTVNGDDLCKLIMSGELFRYWEIDGKFKWTANYEKFMKLDYAPEWEGHIWLSRLYILLPLAQHYCKTKDMKYAKAWYAILSDFIDNNPYTIYDRSDLMARFDMIWVDMQVAWRTINLVYSIYMLDENALTEEQWQKVYAFLKLHAEHMYKEGMIHVEHDSQGNHELQIGMATIMIGCLFPEFGNSQDFINIGRSIVAGNQRGSVFKDGVDMEGSVAYAHFIARLHRDSNLILECNDKELIPGCRESVRKQYEYLYQVAAPNGKSLLFGDAFVLNAMEDIEFVNRVKPLDLSWKRQSVVFEDSGMVVLRNDRFDLYVDGMKTYRHHDAAANVAWGGGYGYHQHFGRPTFQFYGDGVQLICDSGTVNYDRSGLRLQLNSQAGHNAIGCTELPVEHLLTQTAVIEDLEIIEKDLTYDHQVVSIRNTTTGEDGTTFAWIRKFELFPDRLVITDTVDASKKLHFKSYLHMPYYVDGYVDFVAGVQPVSADKKTLNLRRNEKIQTVQMDTPAEVDYRLRMNDETRLDCNEVATREFYTESFTERTVITFK